MTLDFKDFDFGKLAAARGRSRPFDARAELEELVRILEGIMYAYPADDEMKGYNAGLEDAIAQVKITMSRLPEGRS